jgi:hypothetical protein
MHAVIALACAAGFLMFAAPASAQLSTICKFTQGPRAGTTHDYAPRPPIPVGAPCNDGTSSVGVVVAGQSSSNAGNGSPYGGETVGETPQRDGGMSSVCYFTDGPRQGEHQDYAPRPAVPVGTPCYDGKGSTGVVRP